MHIMTPEDFLKWGGWLARAAFLPLSLPPLLTNTN
jgi:hypothetical protein